jgi:hypothetical protein
MTENEYPKWLYNPNIQTYPQGVLIESAEQENKLLGKWYTTPADFPGTLPDTTPEASHPIAAPEEPPEMGHQPGNPAKSAPHKKK